MLDRIRERAVTLIKRYSIAAPGPSAQVRVLSGGNLQKVVIAREFSGDPRVVVAASPTQGLDVGATETVRSYLCDAAANGAAVLVFSEDLDEILEIADRIAVIYEGAIAGEVPASDANIDEIGLMMAGAHDCSRKAIACAPFQRVRRPSSGSCSSPSIDRREVVPRQRPRLRGEGAVAVREQQLGLADPAREEQQLARRWIAGRVLRVRSRARGRPTGSSSTRRSSGNG